MPPRVRSPFGVVRQLTIMRHEPPPPSSTPRKTASVTSAPCSAVHEVLERLHSNVHETDWLLLSSQILSELLADCGHDAAWAKPLAWETYASTRYDALREQLRSLLDAARRHSSRPPPDTEGWYAQGGKIWVRVGTNSFGHPDFEWRDLPTYMLHEHESRAAEFVLDTHAVESFLAEKLTAPRWRFPHRLRPAR